MALRGTADSTPSSTMAASGAGCCSPPPPPGSRATPRRGPGGGPPASRATMKKIPVVLPLQAARAAGQGGYRDWKGKLTLFKLLGDSSSAYIRVRPAASRDAARQAWGNPTNDCYCTLNSPRNHDAAWARGTGPARSGQVRPGPADATAMSRSYHGNPAIIMPVIATRICI